MVTKISLLILATTALLGNASAYIEWKMTCARGGFAVCSGYCDCRPNGEVLCPIISVPQYPMVNTLCCNAAATGCVANANCVCDQLDPPCGKPGHCKLITQDIHTLWIDTKTGTKYCRHHKTGAAAGIFTGSCLHYLDGKVHTVT